MRQAGTIPSKHDADRFVDYLLSLGITAKADGADDKWAIWILDENQVPRSKEELEKFREQPADPRYEAARQSANEVRRQAAEKVRRARKNYVDMRNEWASPWRRRPVTIALIAACLAVEMGVLGMNRDELFFSSVSGAIPEIQNGEVWRLVTPIFLHFGLMHLAFNLWWLYDLGTLIERSVRSVRFALLVLAIAIPSNIAQFVAAGPAFGGMSGVVYGLFGYAWVRGRLDPTCGLFLRPDVAFWMIGWFVLCGIGVIPHVANWAHGGGLAVGALLAYLTHTLDRLRRKT